MAQLIAYADGPGASTLAPDHVAVLASLEGDWTLLFGFMPDPAPPWLADLPVGAGVAMLGGYALADALTRGQVRSLPVRLSAMPGLLANELRPRWLRRLPTSGVVPTWSRWRSTPTPARAGGADPRHRPARADPAFRGVQHRIAGRAGWRGQRRAGGEPRRRGDRSSIVARLDVVSTPRCDVDFVVTEHGIADLRGRTDEGRAEALIAVAAPEHRDALGARGA